MIHAPLEAGRKDDVNRVRGIVQEILLQTVVVVPGVAAGEVATFDRAAAADAASYEAINSCRPPLAESAIEECA